MFYAHCLIEHDLNPDSKRKSKVVMASSFLESMGWGDEDPESFLRQHRAWIKEQKDKYKQKTEK
jgi:predicted metal-dependent hydrolase